MSTYREKQNAERIRELEAKLASQRMVFESVRAHDEEMRTSYLQARARAEKAELELKSNIAFRDSHIAVLQAINAELTKAMKDYHECLTCGRDFHFQPDYWQPREREAD